MSVPQKSFIRAIKSKIIIALSLACFALLLAWGVSKVVFNEMLSTVQDISDPGDRLRLVNKISRRIASLDQQQKKLAFDDPGNYTKLFRESGELRSILDSLSILYADDSAQFERIKTIGTLLAKRDKQFIDYLKVRERLINNKSFSSRVRNLSTLVSKNAETPDSTIVTTEQRTSTTTIYSTEEKPKGFLNRLFGKKKPEENKTLRVVNQENVRRDTISVSTEAEAVAKSLEVSLKAIEKDQRRKSVSFLNQEAALSDANTVIISQMLAILREVESEVVRQIDANSVKAQKVVNQGIKTIGIIMVVFFLITALLLYFILTDITRSNRYRRQLEFARDEAEYHSIAKQRFLSNMSHEIRTPLQSIIGYAEMLKQQTKPRKQDIEAIFHSSEHLLQIVNEVLDYNRITSGKLSFSKQSFHIENLLKEVVSAMQPQAEKKSILLRTELDLEPLSYISGDPFRLKQILYNLIGNAIKFTHVGEVVLSAFYKRQADQVHFTFIVKDTGIGLSEDESKRVFNEFEQIDTPERDALNQAGAGLGLNIVKSLVDNQGGRIYVTSREGLGSSFTIYLTFEVAEGQSVDIGHTLTAKSLNGSFKGKVWVVDDDRLILDLCGLLLEKNGIMHQCFQSATVMLETPWQPEVTHILMDIRMSDMNGIDLCKAFRNRLGDHVKIFAMTAQVLDEVPAQLLKHGFDGVIQKPFKEHDLLSVLHIDGVDRNDRAAPGVQRHLDKAAEVSYSTFDTSVLEKMTFGDRGQLIKILNRFITDCEVDIALLQQCMLGPKTDQLYLVLHRLSGRIAQIGAKKLAAQFRSLEIATAVEDLSGDQNDEITTLIGKLEILLCQVKQKVEHEGDYPSIS